jgi:hypothetical protein
MGLFLASVDVWTTKKPGNRKKISYWNLFLLNTNRLSGIHERDNDYLNFLFSEDPDDHRDSPDYIEAYIFTQSDALTELRYFHDLVPTSKFETLPIFPNFDPTATPVNTLVAWENIAYAYTSYQDFIHDRCHVVYYRDSWKRVECLVDMSWLTLWQDQT